MSEHSQGTPEARKDYELHNMITGEMAAAALVSLLRGDDPTAAVAEWTAGTDGHPIEMAANLGQMHGKIKQLRLEQVEAAVDADGKTLFDQFQSIISRLIAERLNKDVEVKVTGRLAYTAELMDMIENPQDDEESQWAQKMLIRFQEREQEFPDPIRFVTDYHGIEQDNQGRNRADNGIIEEAFDRLYKQRLSVVEGNAGHDVMVGTDKQMNDLIDHLNGLFPSKLGFEVSASGTVTIRIDGKQVELTVAQ